MKLKKEIIKIKININYIKKIIYKIIKQKEKIKQLNVIFLVNKFKLIQ